MTRGARIGVGIAVSGALLFAASTVFVVALPQNTLRVIDHVPIKIVLILLLAIGIALAGLFVFHLLHLPTVRRLILFLIHTILAVGMYVASTPLGLSLLFWNQDPTGAGQVRVEFKDAGLAGVIAFAAMVIGAAYLGSVYKDVCQHEELTGRVLGQ